MEETGATSIDISWNKSHATLQMMIDNSVDVQRSVHNGIADSAADRALNSPAAMIKKEVLDYFALKVAACGVFMQIIYHMVIRLAKADNEEREEAAKTTAGTDDKKALRTRPVPAFQGCP